jgi:hypothetical protein
MMQIIDYRPVTEEKHCILDHIGRDDERHTNGSVKGSIDGTDDVFAYNISTGVDGGPDDNFEQSAWGIGS